jgi:hypothetical protein
MREWSTTSVNLVLTVTVLQVGPGRATEKTVAEKLVITVLGYADITHLRPSIFAMRVGYINV